jgi:hypothetical protein
MSNFSRLTTIVVVILAATISPLAAQTKDDSDDVAGKLDLAHVEVTHSDRHLRFEMRTYEGWRARILRYAPGTGDNKIWVQFKPRQSNRSAWAAEVRYKNGKLRAFVWSACSGCEPFYVRVKRPSKHTVIFRIPRNAVKATGEWIRWAGFSTYSTYPRQDSDCYQDCYDSLPEDKAWFYYSLR